ncbi:MAG TPA: HDIG domain-containing protein [Flavobacteriaceae bacterium]|nr:HDIG domain-containing protein [Flavobacteriaceae bacterium]
MKIRDLFLSILDKQSLIYKAILFIGSILLVMYLLPRGGHFKYQFQKGKPWQHESLYAPFTYTNKKLPDEIEREKARIMAQTPPYFEKLADKKAEVKANYSKLFEETYVDTLFQVPKGEVKYLGNQIIDKAYKYGVLDRDYAYTSSRSVYLRDGKELQELTYDDLFTIEKAINLLENSAEKEELNNARTFVKKILSRSLVPTVQLDQKLTNNTLDNQIKSINPNIGVVEKGSLIVAKGEVVEGEVLRALTSLESQFKSQVWSESNRTWILIGYVLLVSIVFLMLFLFLKKFRNDIYTNNTKVTFIFFNIILMVFLTTIIVKINADYVYVVPLCILPLILKSFFDARLGFFTHVLTLLLLGFIVPDSFMYLFLHIIAGVVTILSVEELYKRANLFISVGQITLVYIIGYLAFSIIQEGSLDGIEWKYFGYFFLNGMVTLFAHPLIYGYEKIFGLVSDVSLLELSDTNSKLLKELSLQAPGTFHHSLNVANLAEAAANEINANAMLVRVGALYHDIGKMKNPSFFTENQVNNINPHEDLTPKQSATVIVDHVLDGIEIARKNNIPDRIIDFIRTHHGDSLVYYFYKQQEKENGSAKKEDFQYPGPKPFSKETAILMMCDAVEAASKSLKNPTAIKLSDFVEKIIDTQLESGQFVNADITLREIRDIKKVLKLKLNNMYHLRVEYPE